MKLILVGSAQSKLDDENRIEGWSNEGLSFKGIANAHKLGTKIAKLNVDFAIAYTSVLKRSIETLDIIKKDLDIDIKTRSSYKLNDRHYGVLERKNKDEVQYMYKNELLEKWYKSFDSKPPELVVTDERFPGNDPQYADILKFNLPLSESLKDTYERVVEYFENEISTFLRVGESVLLVTHEGVIRVLIKYLEDISDEEVGQIDIDLDRVLVYELDEELNVCAKKTV